MKLICYSHTFHMSRFHTEKAPPGGRCMRGMTHPTRLIRVIDGKEESYERLAAPEEEVEREGHPIGHPRTGDTGVRQPQPDKGRSSQRNVLGVGHPPTAAAAEVGNGPLKELRRKLAWAVGSVYGVKYIQYNTWPAEYARRAAERLREIHGEPQE